MTSSGLVVVLAVAAAVSLLRGLVPKLPLPGPLLELLCGIALGPTALGLVTVDPLLSATAVLGMAFLLFLAGFEVDVRGLVSRDGAPARGSLVLSLALSIVAGAVLWAVGWQPRAAALVACALVATSVGVVAPLLRDTGLLRSPFGRLTLAGAALGEVAAIVLISLGFSVSHGPVGALAVMTFLVVVAAGSTWAVGALSRSRRIATAVRAQAEGGGQIRIRFTVLAVTSLALLGVSGRARGCAGGLPGRWPGQVAGPGPGSRPPGIPGEAGRDRLRVPGAGLLCYQRYPA